MLVIEKRKGDFPLEIRVSFDVVSGKVLHVFSSSGWIEPEKEEPERLQKLFDNAPDKLKFGDNYEKVSDLQDNGVRKVIYQNRDY